MRTVPLRPLLAVIAGGGTLLVLGGAVLDTWRLAVLGLALLQAAVVLVVLRSRPAPAPVDRGLRDAVARLDERVQAMDLRMVVEAQATQRLLEQRWSQSGS